jgi:mRNA interferase MazF
VICQFGDVVVVRFPFTDLTITKPRPAVAISAEAFSAEHGQTVLAMVTTGARSVWPTDIAITDLAAAGLRHPSVIRWKLFTLTNDQLATRIGRLIDADRHQIASAAARVFGF